MTQLLSTADIGRLQAVIPSALPDTATVLTFALVDDGQGEGVPGYSAGITVACRVEPATFSERVIAAKLTEVGDWIVTLPAGTVLTVVDRLLINGRTLEVKAIMAPESWEVERVVLAVEVV